MTPAPSGQFPTEVHHFGPLRFIPGRQGGRYPYCHSLVLEGEETWVVDPSADKDYFQRLAATGRVTAVFLSHFHEDHQKYNHLFPEARFYVPATEEAAFTSLEGIFRFMGIEDERFREYWRQTLLMEFHYRPLENLALYHPGQQFQLGSLTLEIVPAPGHTPGHSCFFFPRQGVLYLADVDLTPFGPWYGDAASSLEDFEETLARMAGFEAKTYLTAHEKGIFSPGEFREALAVFQAAPADREARLLAELRTPRTLEQLVARRLIYGKAREPAFVYDHMEGRMLQKHLARLRRRGLIALDAAGWWHLL
jgi:glyoxylase-like metal-dependent hydrolase (beta-lactamase superfamily II)